jgi:branched-chain amino acid transport system substrate-binding protein
MSGDLPVPDDFIINHETARETIARQRLFAMLPQLLRARRRHRRRGRPASGAPSGPPIRIGRHARAYGPLASTALVHQLVGDIYVEQINKKNGLLRAARSSGSSGRPVEANSRARCTSKLITVDKVDLMGPYATGAILPRWASHATARSSSTTPSAFRASPNTTRNFRRVARGRPRHDVPEYLNDAPASTEAPKTIAIVTRRFPSVRFIARRA